MTLLTVEPRYHEKKKNHQGQALTHCLIKYLQSNIRMKVVKEVGEGDTCVIISKPPHKEEKEHYNTQF